MLITFLDKNNKYDGSSIKNKPLDGAQKSIILLSESLASIGHIVRVYNNCYEPKVINNFRRRVTFVIVISRIIFAIKIVKSLNSVDFTDMYIFKFYLEQRTLYYTCL